MEEDAVGWKRGEIKKEVSGWASDGAATDFDRPWVFGPIAAAFGAVEAQGRGSLHPHILVWLLLAPMQDVVVLLMRDKGKFQERVNLWMRQLISSITSVQESAVAQLRSQLSSTVVPPSSADVHPLPFGPKEQAYFHADGELETATAEELAMEDNAPESNELFYCVPGADPDETYQSAIHAKLPLRNHAGDAVDQGTWDSEYNESSTGLWKNLLKLLHLPRARRTGGRFFVMTPPEKSLKDYIQKFLRRNGAVSIASTRASL